MIALFEGEKRALSISDLSVVEFHSVLARKVREKALSSVEFKQIIGRFGADVAIATVQVFTFSVGHKRSAVALIDKYALENELRTLDALQLAVALDLKKKNKLTYFVTSDRRLVRIADLESVPVFDPETMNLPT